MKTIKFKKFVCPKCNGSEYSGGPSIAGNLNHFTYTCHGCGSFSWPQEDGWKYMRLVHMSTFESNEEYRSAMRDID